MRLPRKPRHARLEMLPLMDVVFLILIFLVYAMLVMVVHMGMPVALPTSKSAQPERVIVMALTIQADRAIWLNQQPTTLENLPGDIERRMRADGAPKCDEPTLQIFADGALPYQKLFSVLDVLKEAGLKKISLQARKQDGPADLSPPN